MGSEGEAAAAARFRQGVTGAEGFGDDATGATCERSSMRSEDMLFKQASEAGQCNRKKLGEQRLENFCITGINKTVVHQLTML